MFWIVGCKLEAQVALSVVHHQSTKLNIHTTGEGGGGLHFCSDVYVQINVCYTTESQHLPTRPMHIFTD